MNATTIAHTDANHGLANGWKLRLKMHPERGVLVDREFLSGVLEVLQTVSDRGANPSTQGRCMTMAGILGEMLGEVQ